MAWRELTVGDTRWNVSPVAERSAHARSWRLVLAFRQAASARRSVWAALPLESDSRSALFAEADRMTDEHLVSVLARQIE